MTRTTPNSPTEADIHAIHQIRQVGHTAMFRSQRPRNMQNLILQLPLPLPQMDTIRLRIQTTKRRERSQLRAMLSPMAYFYPMTWPPWAYQMEQMTHQCVKILAAALDNIMAHLSAGTARACLVLEEVVMDELVAEGARFELCLTHLITGPTLVHRSRDKLHGHPVSIYSSGNIYSRV